MDYEKKMIADNEVQREIMSAQEKIISMYRKRLVQSPKCQKELQTFAGSGKQVGSSDYFKLSPMVKEIVVKLYMVNIDIMSKHTKNPLKKLQLWIAKIATQKMAHMAPAKKKKKKDTDKSPSSPSVKKKEMTRQK